MIYCINTLIQLRNISSFHCLSVIECDNAIQIFRVVHQIQSLLHYYVGIGNVRHLLNLVVYFRHL
jgi:hypothetical protein